MASPPHREVVCSLFAHGRRALNRGHVGPLRGFRRVGGAWRGERAVRVPGGGFVAVGAWVPGVRVLKVKFLQKKSPM